MKNSQEKNQSNLINYGDCFALGPHRLILGNSCDPEIIKKLVGNDKVNLLICDIPYGVSLVESKKGFIHLKMGDKIIANDQEQTEETYTEFNRKWLEAIKPYLSVKNSFYIFNSEKMVFALREGIIKAGYRFTQLIIWIKNHAVMGRMNYLIQHELLCYGWLGVHKFYKSPDKTLLFYPKPNKSIYHPTMKPIPLLRHLILNSSNIGDVVFDGFAGSGQIVFACEQTKRRCFMVEIDPEYCQTIIDRYEKLSGLKVSLIKNE